jgi:hypothetical protein
MLKHAILIHTVDPRAANFIRAIHREAKCCHLFFIYESTFFPISSRRDISYSGCNDAFSGFAFLVFLLALLQLIMDGINQIVIAKILQLFPEHIFYPKYQSAVSKIFSNFAIHQIMIFLRMKKNL